MCFHLVTFSLPPLPFLVRDFPDAVLREMSKYEEITEQHDTDGLTYMISPVTLTVKLTHNEDGDPKSPM